VGGLPADVRLAMTPPDSHESEGAMPASLLDAAEMAKREKKAYALLRRRVDPCRRAGQKTNVAAALLRSLPRRSNWNQAADTSAAGKDHVRVM